MGPGDAATDGERGAMSKKADGGPAFPLGYGTEPGMTLRDYFATAVVQFYIATAAVDRTHQEIAEKAYRMADAMLEARKL
jgi:hypothetical protein